MKKSDFRKESGLGITYRFFELFRVSSEKSVFIFLIMLLMAGVGLMFAASYF
jgi:hypothetical protein